MYLTKQNPLSLSISCNQMQIFEYIILLRNTKFSSMKEAPRLTCSGAHKPNKYKERAIN